MAGALPGHSGAPDDARHQTDQTEQSRHPGGAALHCLCVRDLARLPARRPRNPRHRTRILRPGAWLHSTFGRTLRGARGTPAHPPQLGACRRCSCHQRRGSDCAAGHGSRPAARTLHRRECRRPLHLELGGAPGNAAPADRGRHGLCRQGDASHLHRLPAGLPHRDGAAPVAPAALARADAERARPRAALPLRLCRLCRGRRRHPQGSTLRLCHRPLPRLLLGEPAAPSEFLRRHRLVSCRDRRVRRPRPVVLPAAGAELCSCRHTGQEGRGHHGNAVEPHHGAALWSIRGGSSRRGCRQNLCHHPARA